MDQNMKLVHDVADSMDEALAYVETTGLYDNLATFPAARIAVAADMIDRLSGMGYLIAQVSRG